LPGAQLRYLIAGEQRVLGSIGFAAATWTVAGHDRWNGRDASAREAHLAGVMNNARCPLQTPKQAIEELTSCLCRWQVDVSF
jgi:hypothetical protein